MTDCLFDGPAEAAATFVFSHGAGAPMDSDFMTHIAQGLGVRGIKVMRFEFPYMAERRMTGKKKPPPKAEIMMAYFADQVTGLGAQGAVFIGGKSMGGRIASLIVDQLYDAGEVAGLVCLGYPFHPPGKPERLRTAHLEALSAPGLICQGERDPFGTLEDVKTYKISSTITLEWLADGNHDLTPRKASGRTAEQNQTQAIEAIARFISKVA